MIFISGGVRSGKSTFAEKVAIDLAIKTNSPLHYIATGVATDHEMAERIARHQRERENSMLQWKTWEKPSQVEDLANSFQSNDVVLLDCVTTLLNNELFFDKRDWDSSFLEVVLTRILQGIVGIQKECRQLILVSNEVFYEGLNDNELVYHYSRILGHLHQEIVKRAEVAYLVECGIPFLMKGEAR